jgi:hypothetical protein
MKTANITLKRCRELLDRHYPSRPVPDPEDTCSDEITPRLVKVILETADAKSRFKVSYDPANHNDEDYDTWDIIGPGLRYGNVYFDNKEKAAEARDALNSILREHFGSVRRSPELSTDAHRNRVLLDGACCPACGSAYVSRNEGAIKGSVYVVSSDCDDCNAEWMETYGFQGYQDLRID